jgi:hypothetical protein
MTQTTDRTDPPAWCAADYLLHLRHMAQVRPAASYGIGDREAAQWAADRIEELEREVRGLASVIARFGGQP